jgi:hypothetical protein
MANNYMGQAQASQAADSATMGTIAKLGAAAATGGASLAATGLEDGGIINSYQDGGLPNRYADGGIKEDMGEVKQKSQDAMDKKHENFKKKYMKRVQDELEVSKSEVTGGDKPAYGDGGRVQTPWQKEFADSFSGRESKPEMSAYEKNEARRKRYQDSLSPAQKKEREAKMKAQGSYANGGIKDTMGDYKSSYEDGGSPQYASDGMGDIIDSGMDSFADDRVDAKVNDGEAILNVPQQQRFMDLVRGKISVDELGNDDIVEGVPSEYRDSMHEDLEDDSYEESEETDKMAGLEKLLEMLGR